jgi:hypothetical protein
MIRQFINWGLFILFIVLNVLIWKPTWIYKEKGTICSKVVKTEQDRFIDGNPTGRKNISYEFSYKTPKGRTVKESVDYVDEPDGYDRYKLRKITEEHKYYGCNGWIIFGNILFIIWSVIWLIFCIFSTCCWSDILDRGLTHCHEEDCFLYFMCSGKNDIKEESQKIREFWGY